MPLTDIKVRNAKPKDKDYKLFDGDGLFLLVNKRGGKYWRLKYRFEGKEKTLALGVYPDVPLRGHFLEEGDKESWIDGARDLCAKARKQIAAGIDPGALKKAKKVENREIDENTFEAVAREWHQKQIGAWSESHAKTTLRRLERDVFPWLGSKLIRDIEAPDVLKVLQKVEARGAVETAHRVKVICGQVFRYAIATGRVLSDPTAPLKGALTPVKKQHLAAIIDPKEVAQLLRAIDGYIGAPIVKAALQLQPLVFVRPGELRQAKWDEFDLDNALWSIPAERMKTRQPHLVPLSSQSLLILRDLYPMTRRSEYVFPGYRSNARPLSNNAINAALRRMGYAKDEMTGHGFRAMARTILDEVLKFRPDYIEHQLAHAVRDPNGRAYNRTAHLEERRAMMQAWADYLEALREE
ncbi:MAG: integrase [Desulfuromonas sp.]|nr:MAG: integrase [Desulfuromonas sp.]